MGDLDARVRSAAEQWELTVGAELSGGSRSAVFAASDRAGRDLVLKLPAPGGGARRLAAAEAAALEAWAGTGAAVALLAAAADALLLVRARPGRTCPWQPEEHLDDTVGRAAELLQRLWAAPSGPHHFQTLAEHYSAQERVARSDAAFEQRQHREPDRGGPGLRRLPAAALAAEQLITSTSAAGLLHGDFLTKNLVSDAASPVGWVALDPLPMIGEPAAEVGAFAAYHPAELILPVAEALALAVGLDPRRVLRWAAIWTVHQAAQAWRADQESLDGLVSSPTMTALLTG